MKKVRFYWNCRNIDVILPIIGLGWITGFNVNHQSTATVRNREQQEKLDKMVEEGLINIIEVTEL